MTNHTHYTLLRALFEMASEDQPAELPALAARLGLNCSRTLGLLDELDRAGLVDADRVRLTMSGLAHAVITPAAASRSRARAA